MHTGPCDHDQTKNAIRTVHFLADIPSDQGANFVSAIVGFVAGAVVMVAVTLFTAPKPEAELAGLIYGTESPDADEAPEECDDAWYRKPALPGWGAIVLAALCYLPYSL